MDTKNLLERAKNFGFIKSEYYSYFLQYCDKYKINTSERISHFLAQVNYESGYMNYIEEKFTYSAKRLLKVWKYRGRGLLQLTGKKNYLEFSKWYNDSKMFVDNPDLLLQHQFAVLSAFFYWDKKKSNDIIIEYGDEYQICKKITMKINGGYNGLEERFKLYLKISGILYE